MVSKSSLNLKNYKKECTNPVSLEEQAVTLVNYPLVKSVYVKGSKVEIHTNEFLVAHNFSNSFKICFDFDRLPGYFSNGFIDFVGGKYVVYNDYSSGRGRQRLIWSPTTHTNICSNESPLVLRKISKIQNSSVYAYSYVCLGSTLWSSAFKVACKSNDLITTFDGAILLLTQRKDKPWYLVKEVVEKKFPIEEFSFLDPNNPYLIKE